MPCELTIPPMKYDCEKVLFSMSTDSDQPIVAHRLYHA